MTQIYSQLAGCSPNRRISWSWVNLTKASYCSVERENISCHSYHRNKIHTNTASSTHAFCITSKTYLQAWQSISHCILHVFSPHAPSVVFHRSFRLVEGKIKAALFWLEMRHQRMYLYGENQVSTINKVTLDDQNIFYDPKTSNLFAHLSEMTHWPQLNLWERFPTLTIFRRTLYTHTPLFPRDRVIKHLLKYSYFNNRVKSPFDPLTLSWFLHWK